MVKRIRRLHALLRLPAAMVQRVPFTIAMAAGILAVTAVTDTMTRPATATQLARWGFNLGDLRSGRLWQLLVLTPFQAYQPHMILPILGSLLFFVGAAEYVLGTRRTLVAFWTTHVIGYVGAYLLLWPLSAAGWGWAVSAAHDTDVGSSAASFGALAALIAFLPPAGRRAAFAAAATYLLSFLVLDRRVWDVEHLIAFASGLGIGAVMVRRRGEPWPSLLVWPRFSRRQRPTAVAWAVGVMGIINVLSALLSPRHRGLTWLEENLPIALVHGGRQLVLVLGFALLVLALGLAHGRRQAWRLTVAALCASAVLHLTKGADLPEALLALGLLLLLLAWRGEFVARSDPPSVRQGLLLLFALVLVVPLYGLAGFYVLRSHFQESYSALPALRETGARLLFTSTGEFSAGSRRATWFLDSITVLGWSGLGAALLLVLRGALAPHPRPTERERARRLLERYGQSGTSYMTLWPGNRVFLAPGGKCYLSYRLAAGVALVLGDPVGAEDSQVSAIEAFDHFCREHGWEHAFLGATPELLALYARLGYRALEIGEEALIPLQGLEFRGKGWQDVRTALNHATREGIRFELYEGGNVPGPVRDQLRAISAEWLARKRLPELGFTLGTVEDVDDPNVYVAVAADSSGRVHGFLDWLPMYAARGWVVDLMRRRADAFKGVMEFLIGSSLLAFADRGYRVASLASAPLANVEAQEAGSTLERALTFVYQHFDRFYHFQSLFLFKKKFQPRWQGVYLVFRTQTELPRIGLAVLRAYLPDLGPRVVAGIIGHELAGRWASPEHARSSSDATRPGRAGA